VTAVADGEESAGHTEHGSSTAATTTATRCLAIAKVPIGARVVAENPRSEEFDDSFAEPVQSEWARVSFLIVRNDLSVVEAEFIRPRAWIEGLGLVKGARIDLAVPELGIDGLAEVTAIRPCPPIAEGEGRVVTGKFVTRDVANVVRITLASGTEIRATDVHPVWSVDREDWVPAGKLEPGEHVDTLDGPVAVTSVEPLERHPAVYNLEVHGEHVYRVAVDGVLVHNGDLTCVSARSLVPSGSSRLGIWGEERLAAALNWAGFKPSAAFRTSLGPRYIDRLVDGIAHESKAGIDVAINGRMWKQMLKDKELLDKGLVEGIRWHFWQGADKSITDALTSLGIPFTVH